jgi:hypothetical protein
MTADPIIQYAVILSDDEGATLTLVGDDATSLADHVFTTLQGWPEAAFASEHRAITEGGAMRFDDWPRPAGDTARHPSRAACAVTPSATEDGPA